MAVEVYYLIIFQESRRKWTCWSKKLLCWTLFYIYFYNYLDLYELEFVWTLYYI